MIFSGRKMFWKKNVRKKIGKKSHPKIPKKSKILIFRKIKIFNFLRICVWDFFIDFFGHFFSKYVFFTKKYIFLNGIFFKAHLLVEENHFGIVSERSQQYKTTKNHVEDMLSIRICTYFEDILQTWATISFCVFENLLVNEKFQNFKIVFLQE